MIIKLKGANFSTNNINALLNSYFVSITGGSCVTAAEDKNSVSKDNPTYSNTFTVNTDYSVSNVEVTMGGSDITSTAVDKTSGEAGAVITISVPTVTGNISIKFTAAYSGVEEPDTTNYTFTINPTPSTATVTLTASGYTQSGNSITVPSGTSVSWSVSASGYTTQSGTQVVTSTSSKSVTLSASSEQNVTLTITPDPADASVVFTKDGSTLTATNNTVSVPNGSKVSVRVSKTGYLTTSKSYTLTSNRSETITLTEASDTIVVTEYPYVVTTWEQGSYSGAGLNEETGRIRAGYLNMEPNCTISMQLNGNWQGYVCYPNGTSHTLMGTQSWTQSEIFNVGTNNEQVLIVLKNTSNSNITPSDYSEADGGIITINAPVEQEAVATYTSSDLVIGGLTTATATVNTTEQNRLRTGLLECQANDTVKVALPEGLICYVAYMETDTPPMKFSSWSEAGATVEVAMPYTGSFCVVIAHSDKKTTFSDTSVFTGTIELRR